MHDPHAAQKPRLPYLKTLALASALILAALSHLPAAHAATNYHWDSLPIGGGGFVSGIITSKTTPHLRYARTDVGGAYRWDEPTSKWIPLQDWTTEADKGYMAVESLAIDESNPQNVYMFVGLRYFSGGRSAILRSSDYGKTFQIVEVTPQFKSDGNEYGRATGERLQVDPNNPSILYCATRRYGLFRSQDAGLTWSRLASLPVTDLGNVNGLNLVVIDPDSAANGRSQTLFVGASAFGSSLYRSDDAGATFTLVTGGPADLLPQRAVLAADGNLFIAYANGFGPSGTTGYPLDKGAIWKHNIDTQTWTNVTPAGRTHPFGGISVDPANPNRLIASSVNSWWFQGNDQYGDRIFLTTNGGATWTDIVERGFDLDPNGVTWLAFKDQSIHWTASIEFDPFDTNRAFVVSGNGLYRADDLDAQTVVWTSNVEGLEETVPLGLVSIKDGPTLSVIGDYDGFRHTDPKNYAPIHRPRIGTTTGLAVAEKNPNIAARVGGYFNTGGRLFLSQDMGLTWTETPNLIGSHGLVALSADGSVLIHSQAYDNEGRGPIPTSQTRLSYRSTDNGVTWTEITGLNMQNAHPVADPVNAQKFYAVNNATAYASSDAGASFTPAATLPTEGNKRLAPVPGREGHLWLSYAPKDWETLSAAHGLYRSTDSAATFTQIPNITSAGAVGTGKAAPGADYPTLYIWGTVNGVEGIHRSTDQGATWLRVNDDAHQYGGPGNAQLIVGDQNVFGRVYMSTVGRGIIYGEPILDSIAYADWAATALANQDPTLTAENADPDHDSLTNLLEWILQTDPLEPTNLATHTLAFSANAPRIAFQQLAELSTATLTLEISTDLQTWADITTQFTEQEPTQSTDSLLRTRAFHPTNGPFPNTLFLRAKAQR